VYSTPEILSGSITLIILFVSIYANNKNLRFFGNLFFMFLLVLSYLWNVDKDFVELDKNKSSEINELYKEIKSTRKKIDLEKNTIVCYTPKSDLEIPSFNQCIYRRSERAKEIIANKTRWEKEISEYQSRLERVDQKEARKDIALIKIFIGIIISTIFSFASLVSCTIIREYISGRKTDLKREQIDELEISIPEINLELEQKIKNLRESGLSFGKIAEQLNLSKSTVHYLYNKNN
jgi:DNA-binding transcriptional regulator YiaG